jgi:drug/metabolite transporter (DMT)-like permease
LFGEKLSMTAWAGVCLISFGIISLTLSTRQGGHMNGAGLALLNAVVIAAYTLIDGLGVRRSGAPIAYTMWLALLGALPLFLWCAVAKGAALARHTRKHLLLGLVGAIGMLASYGLALWAMTVAPVALVAALRETSILWATAIAALVLKEEVSGGRIAAVSIIALGVAALRLA